MLTSAIINPSYLSRTIDILNVFFIILCLSSFDLKELKLVAKCSNNLPSQLKEIDSLIIYPAEKPNISVDSFTNYLKRIKTNINTTNSYIIRSAEIGGAFECTKVTTKSTFPCPKSGMLGVCILKNGDSIYLCFDPYTPLCFTILNEETTPIRMTNESCSKDILFWIEYLQFGKRKM